MKYLFILITGIIFSQENKFQSNMFFEIQKTYDVNINYNYSTAFFPKSWLTPRISANGIQIELFEAKRMIPIIEQFLSKYSKPFLKTNIKDIYILKSMYFFNKKFGGTSASKGIYISNNGSSEDFLLALMHSEFSSILFRNYKSLFPFKEWNEINESNFLYVGNGVEMLDENDLYGQTTSLLTNGFIVKYAMSSIENDFNMMIHCIFTKPNELKVLITKYEKIKQKYELVLRFYNQINSGVEF